MSDQAEDYDSQYSESSSSSESTLHDLLNRPVGDAGGRARFRDAGSAAVGDVIGPELCGGTKTEKGKAVGWLMGSLVSLSSKLRKN
jgi:hypothetical protein